MENIKRTKKTIINSVTGIISQSILMILGFVVRKIFITNIGVDYLGINGLFVNIMELLNLAELGIGSAIIYNLYSALAGKKEEDINTLMYLYKYIYTRIGIFIIVVGLICSLFIENLIKDNTIKIEIIRIAFLIQILSTSTTYFFAYKRSLLNADQNNYVSVLVDTTINVVMSLIRIFILVYTKNYILYLIIQVLQNIISNLIISYICNKKYKYLKNSYDVEKLKEFKKNVTKDMKDIFVSKIGSFIYFSTDNIIISYLIGITPIGILSNYNLLLTTVSGFINQLSNPVLAGLGNFINTSNDRDKLIDIFRKFNFIIYTISSFCFVGFVTLSNMFIEVWAGEIYKLNQYIVLIVGINFLIDKIQIPLWQLLYVKGRFDIEKKASIVSSIVNISLSVMLTLKFGLIGVLLGTTIGNIVFTVYRLRLLNSDVFKKAKYSYLKDIIFYVSVTLIQLGICSYATNIVCKQATWMNVIIGAIICILVLIITTILFYRKSVTYIHIKNEMLYPMICSISKRGIVND
ncbi:hypothetical protein EAI30_00280 [Romboutsia ilealis]|uniref:Oligosaccharide flippase family protein n=1 Tax=Romboutsia faecis TaxID=2764597 RepID=A0ABR7JMB2_9FIRM|nr:oligosaccharide flippase family protein [Romboutsia faecis]MBC5995843.1 oligosaccharide flippase family protein [Romboutsia faecis]MRN23042.1 hypothetical protein [Romboutsia ilealis]